MALILTPLAFCFAGYLLFFSVFSSYFKPAVGIWKMLTAGVVHREGENLMINKSDIIEDFTEETPNTLPSTLVTFPKYGDLYGRIEIPSAGIDAPLYYGDGNEQLNKGVCQYIGSMFIGSGSTVLVSGHNNTFFHTLGQAEAGDEVTVTTNYGVYTYEVERSAIWGTNDERAFDLSAKEENLVLYTCYPFNMLGLTKQRYFVYCKYLSGPMIDYEK